MELIVKILYFDVRFEWIGVKNTIWNWRRIKIVIRDS